MPSKLRFHTASTNCILNWALVLSGQRVRVRVSTNVWSFPGQETGTILANLAGFLSQMPVRPGFVVVECGTNNIYHNGASGTLAAITADWTAITLMLKQHGIRTIFLPILPRIGGTGYFSTVLSAAHYGVMDRCNRWLNALAQASGDRVAVASSCLADITDPASVGASPRPNYTVEGTQPGVTGAYYIGKAIAAILRSWYPPIDLLPARTPNGPQPTPSATR